MNYPVKHRILVIVLAMLSGLTLLTWAAEKGWKIISPQALKQMITAGEKPVLINTMSYLECSDHSIPGSLCIPSEEFEKRASQLPAEKDTPVVMYCESETSVKSCEAADKAVRLGYTQVSVLDGGMPAWKQHGYEMASIERIPRQGIPSIKPPVLRQWLMEKRDFLLVDIRPEKAFRQGHIEGAVNIPLYQLHLRYTELPLNRLLILVDNRGFRTSIAGSYLVRKGLEVKRLFGGMAKWEAMIAKEKAAKK
jgi:rhodanese-related sulfurtransferase